MNYLYSDYEIVEPKPPPMWVYHLPALKRIWDNPISQHLYKPTKYRFLPPPIIGFISATILSIFLNGIFQSEPFEDSAPIAGLSLSVGVPAITMAFYACVRIVIMSLAMNPLRIRKLVFNHTMTSWLSLPLTDTTLFHSLNFPSFMGCLKAYENVLAVYAGLVIPFLLFSFKNGNGIGEIFSSAEITSTWPVTYAVWAIFLPLLLSILLTLTSGMYSYLFRGPNTVAVSILHFGACCVFTFLVRMAWFTSFETDSLQDIPMVIAGEIVAVLVMFGLAWLTGRIGVMIFARYRRPGFYEEEWASAAGLPQY